MTLQIVPEFSRLVPVTDLVRGPQTVDVEATEAERAALAQRLGVQSVERLSASVRVTAEAGGLVRMRGRISAAVTQTCVVTLEPVANVVEAALHRIYGPPGADAGSTEAVDVEEEPLDILVDGAVDIGEAAAEQLALELDPFPRAPGARFEGFSVGQAPQNPFEALNKIRGKSGKGAK